MHSGFKFIFSEYKINLGNDLNTLKSWKSCIITPAGLVRTNWVQWSDLAELFYNFICTVSASMCTKELILLEVTLKNE